LASPALISLQPSTLLAVLHDVVLSLAGHGFERIFVINGHGGNIATARAAFAQAYATATSPGAAGERGGCVAGWPTGSWPGRCCAKPAKRYGKREGHHATPSEIALTLHLEPSLVAKQRPLPEAGAWRDPSMAPRTFRRRHPDGRMGSDPYLASAAARQAACSTWPPTALAADLRAVSERSEAKQLPRILS
jgi:creatinine amidohydrolase